MSSKLIKIFNATHIKKSQKCFQQMMKKSKICGISTLSKSDYKAGLCCLDFQTQSPAMQ